MSQKKIKQATLAAAKKSFTIGVDNDKDGRRLISLSLRGPITPNEVLDGLIGGLAATYINVWGSPMVAPGQEPVKPEEQLTPEQYCEMVATKVLARLTNFKVQQGTIQ